MTVFQPCSEVIEWIGLRRVHERRIGLVESRWLSHGMPVPCWLVHPLDELAKAGLLTVSETDVCGPLRRAQLTKTGQVRYAELCSKYGMPPCQPLRVPPPQFPQNPDRPPVEPHQQRRPERPGDEDDGPGGRSDPPPTEPCREKRGGLS